MAVEYENCGCGGAGGGSGPGGQDECGSVTLLRLCDQTADDCVPFLRHLVHDCDGQVTASTDTELDGTTPYTPTGTVVRCGSEQTLQPAPQIASTVQRQTDAGTVTIAAGARSVTVVVYAGTPTVSLGGDTPVPLPAGTSLTWSVDRGGPASERLVDEFTFTAAAGDDLLVTSTREAS